MSTNAKDALPHSNRQADRPRQLLGRRLSMALDGDGGPVRHHGGLALGPGTRIDRSGTFPGCRALHSL